MNKLKIIIAGGLVAITLFGGAVAVTAKPTAPEKPKWVKDNGTVNINEIPDGELIPYQCWNGKNIKVTGRAYKQKANGQAKPGSSEFQIGVDKVNELRKIKGVVTTDQNGTEIVNIDDNNPAIVEVMKKYELKENPECK